MKKILILLVTLTVLTIGVFGGIAYADIVGHEPMKGNKLVGFGLLGTLSLPGNQSLSNHLSFRINNPDCENTITIEQMSIINSSTGQIIYEGPLLMNTWSFPAGSMESVVVPELGPHEALTIMLPNYFPIGDPHDPDGWMPPVGSGSAMEQNPSIYTIEITWSSPGSSCPLIGDQEERLSVLDTSQTPAVKLEGYLSKQKMVNMKQR